MQIADFCSVFTSDWLLNCYFLSLYSLNSSHTFLLTNQFYEQNSHEPWLVILVPPRLLCHFSGFQDFQVFVSVKPWKQQVWIARTNQPMKSSCSHYVVGLDLLSQVHHCFTIYITSPAFQTRPNFFWGKAVGEGSWKLWGTKDRLVGMHEEEYFINDKILPQRQTFRCQWWTVYGTLTFLILQVSLEIQHWMGGGATSGNRTNHKNVREQGYALF